jgi:hypothetical protein
MLRAVATDLMASMRDAANQVRVSFGYPSQDKKRGLGSVFGQEIQQKIGADFDAGRKSGPIFVPVTDFSGMIVILKIDTEGIDHKGLSPSFGGQRRMLARRIGRRLSDATT